jgi:hypothetical protein
MPRPVTVNPDSPEGREIGMSSRMTGEPSPIPGGETHIVNHPTVRQRVPVGDSPAEYGAMEAHGVPPSDATFHDRAEAERGPNSHAPITVPPAAKVNQRPAPIPVYVVTEGSGVHPLRTATPRHITVPSVNGHDPVPIVGVDDRRTKVRLMNTDAANDIQIGQDLTSLIGDSANANKTIGGALLPHGMTSYMDIETQDELWAIALTATASVTLNMIIETSIPGAG